MAYLGATTGGFVEEGVKVRYPGDATQGTTNLAYRYSSYDKIPLFARPAAQQIGAGGYYYVPANLWETLRDNAARAGDAVAIAAGKAAEGFEQFFTGAGKWVGLTVAGYLLTSYLSRRR